MIDEGEILTPDEAAKLLRLHRRTVYALIRRGEIPAFRLGARGKWRLRRSDLLSLSKKQEGEWQTK